MMMINLQIISQWVWNTVDLLRHSDDERGAEDDVLALPHGLPGHHARHRGLQLLDGGGREYGAQQEASGDAATAQEWD